MFETVTKTSCGPLIRGANWTPSGHQRPNSAAARGAYEAGGIDLRTNAEFSGNFGGAQMVLNCAVIVGARDPDVTAAQPLPQCGRHGVFVQSPVPGTVGEDQFAPSRRQDRRRRAGGQRPISSRSIAFRTSTAASTRSCSTLDSKRNAAGKRKLNRRSTEYRLAAVTRMS